MSGRSKRKVSGDLHWVHRGRPGSSHEARSKDPKALRKPVIWFWAKASIPTGSGSGWICLATTVALQQLGSLRLFVVVQNSLRMRFVCVAGAAFTTHVDQQASVLLPLANVERLKIR